MALLHDGQLVVDRPTQLFYIWIFICCLLCKYTNLKYTAGQSASQFGALNFQGMSVNRKFWVCHIIHCLQLNSVETWKLIVSTFAEEAPLSAIIHYPSLQSVDSAKL